MNDESKAGKTVRRLFMTIKEGIVVMGVMQSGERTVGNGAIIQLTRAGCKS